MRHKAILGLSLGAAAVLSFGIWLGQTSAPRNVANEEPATAVERAPSAASDRTQSATSDRTQPRAARVAKPVLARPVTPGLEQDLRDADPLVRRNAIVDLVKSGNADPKTLAAASRDADLNVALAATEGLGTLYRDGAVSAAELVARTSQDAPAKVRVTAINALGQVASPESARALIDLLARGSDVDRRSAAIVLVHQDPQLAVPALIAALADTDENVRMNAREALKTIARGRDFGTDASAWQRWWQSRAT